MILNAWLDLLLLLVGYAGGSAGFLAAWRVERAAGNTRAAAWWRTLALASLAGLITLLAGGVLVTVALAKHLP